MIRLHLPPQLRTEVSLTDLLQSGSEGLELIVVVFVLGVLATGPRASMRADGGADAATLLVTLVIGLTVAWGSL